MVRQLRLLATVEPDLAQDITPLSIEPDRSPSRTLGISLANRMPSETESGDPGFSSLSVASMPPQSRLTDQHASCLMLANMQNAPCPSMGNGIWAGTVMRAATIRRPV